MAQAVDHEPTPGSRSGRPRRRRPRSSSGFYRSAVGKKYVMAITGIVFMLYVFVHMFGNLKMYLGPGQFDHYAEFLREILVPDPARSVGSCGSSGPC